MVQPGWLTRAVDRFHGGELQLDLEVGVWLPVGRGVRKQRPTGP